MKMSIFGMLFILVALTVGPLVYFNGGSEYLNSMFSKTPKSKIEINRDVVYAPVTTDERVKVFKWKDENGVWQFGNSPPPGLAGVETMTLQPNVNIMKSIDVPEEEPEERRRTGVVSLGHDYKSNSSKDKKDKNGVGISKESLENPYAPDSISELMKSSQNLQGVLNQRQQLQQNALGK